MRSRRSRQSRKLSHTQTSVPQGTLNSLQHRGDTLQPVFRMSAYNISRKRKVLETNLQSDEITNFYPIFLYSLVISFRTSMFSFRESYFRLVGPFDWGYSRTQFLLSVSWNRYAFTLAGYRNEKSATDPALQITM